jgi:hypothetical protein
MMDRVWGVDAGFDLLAMSAYSNITSISESPVEEGLLYVGTDDGLIQISEDGGENWRKIDQVFGVPQYGFVNDVKADKHDADTVYACWDDHKTGDYKPYLVKSTDRGKTWTSMVGDLPDRHLVWRIEQDHENENLFFLGTEYGLFVSLNAGENWIKMSAGAPNIPFRDLAIQKRENDLVGATFGRGFYVLDDYSPLRELSDEMLKTEEFFMFPVRRAFRYIQSDVLGGTIGSQGDSYFRTPNPDFGATFTYYVKEMPKTKKQTRKANEAKIAKAGGDVPIPSWEELREEENEEAPKLYFEISNSDDELVARIDGNASEGMHRTTWNLQLTSVTGRNFGPMAAPGTYQVQAFKWINNEATALGESREVELVSIDEPSLEPQDPAEMLAFQKDVAKLQNAVSATAQSLTLASEQVAAAKEAISSSTNASAEIMAATRKIELAIKALEVELSGDPLKEERYEQTVPSIGSRIGGALFGSMRNTHGITETQRQQVEIAKADFEEISEKIQKLLTDDLEEFKSSLDDAGVPWTAGRAIPDVD